MKRLLIIFALCIIGLLVSVTLAIEHYKAVAGIDDGLCLAENSVEGCGSVLESNYGTLFGVPVGIWGALYFLALILLLFLGAQELLGFKLIKISLSVLTGLGVVGSVAFVMIMAFVLKSVCFNCLTVHITNFITAGLIFYHINKSDNI